jgi:hypothetical protein
MTEKRPGAEIDYEFFIVRSPYDQRVAADESWIQDMSTKVAPSIPVCAGDAWVDCTLTGGTTWTFVHNPSVGC